jgi:hypothetical protein
MSQTQSQSDQSDQQFLVFIMIMIRYQFGWKYRNDFDQVIPSHTIFFDFIFDVGGNGSMIMLNDTDFFVNGESNHLSDSIIQQSLPSTLHPKDIETTSDDDYTSVNLKDEQHPVQIADS